MSAEEVAIVIFVSGVSFAMGYMCARDRYLKKMKLAWGNYLKEWDKLR